MNGVAGIGYTLLRTVDPFLIESAFVKNSFFDSEKES